MFTDIMVACLGMFLQKTIRKRAVVQGHGLHSGKPCTLTFVPAPAGTGVHFVRADLSDLPSLKVDARNVTATGFATTIGGERFSVSTVEHCMAALSALRIDNLFIELDGPEVPIVDGSAKEFLNAILNVGVIEQEQPRKYCYITQPIYYSEGEKQAYVVPYQGLRVSVTIDFPHPSIGKQKIDLDINEVSFSREVAPARTFGFISDLEALQRRGLALGGSLNNAIGLDESRILNPEGLRYPDEFVRHKALDALGDLVTLTMPLMGHLVLYKAGHDVMNKLILKIQQSYQHFKLIELGADLSQEIKIKSGLWSDS
jgi:UDP-3-O-[3-hydroxymyristoyl] N-acetylglucosamine deacetylase